MNKTKRISAKILASVMTVAILFSMVSLNTSAIDAFKAVFSPKKSISFATISDTHYYPKALTDNYCDAFMKYAKTGIGREPYESPGILESALAALEEHAKTNGLDYVIIPGDLTSNGEYVAHTEFAKRLEQFEKDSGLQVMVIDGNHDINKVNAAVTFENGKKESVRATTPEEFREIYKNLGYDLAYHTYTPTSGKANMLSYSVKLDGYRIILMDLTKYSSEVTDCGEDVGETGGVFTPDFLKWVLAEIADAKADGETVIGVNHQNLVPHYTGEYAILRGFNVDNWEEVGDTLADAGMHFALTGHLHFNAVDATITDDGETLHEVNTDSLTSFPNYFREIKMTTDVNGKDVMDIKSYDVDCVLPVTVEGYTYETPFRIESLKNSFFDENGLSGLVRNLAESYISDFAVLFAENGITNTLKDSFGLDLESIIKGFFGDGLKIGNIELFTTKNLMSFIEDLFEQIEKNYMTDPTATAEYLQSEVDKLLKIQVSDLPNSRFYDEYGIGSKTEPGTFEDMIEDVIIYMYEAKYDIKDDPFMLDAIDGFDNGDTIYKVFDSLIEVVGQDLLQDKLLSDLKLNVSALFPKGTTGHTLGIMLNVLIKVIFLGDTSYLNISNKVLETTNKLGVTDFDSLWGIVEKYMDEYLTDSQLDGVGQTIAAILIDFSGYGKASDNFEAKLVYDGKVTPEATQANYRLPTTLSVTLGKDQSSRNISWYSKYSVTGTDIEIIKDTENPVFAGKNAVPSGITITAANEKTTRQFPGVDLGVIGIMNYEFPMQRHVISVSGLEAGEKYLYRVGDASRGWWSETGSFEAADLSSNTTFIHVSDPQSQSARQYDTFASVIAKAYSMYDDAGFTVNTGDCVDHGDNFHQWQWLFDEAADTLMSTAMMPASGNHEEKGTSATVTNFTISNAPEQDTTTGIYYSFDYNNTHFAVLNSNDLGDDNGLSSTQIEWLKNDMESSDADWKFVTLHKAPYSNGSHYDDDDVCAIRSQLSVLMPELDIDIVFSGHDHVYLRTDAMINNKVESVTTSTATFNGKTYTVKDNPQGTIYAISGCSGVKVYEQKDESLTDSYFPRAEAIYDAKLPCFSGIRIVGDTLYFDAYTVDVKSGATENIDSFALQKDDVEIKEPEKKPDNKPENKPVVDINDTSDKTDTTTPVAPSPAIDKIPNTGDISEYGIRIAYIALIFSVGVIIVLQARKKRMN